MRRVISNTLSRPVTRGLFSIRWQSSYNPTDAQNDESLKLRTNGDPPVDSNLLVNYKKLELELAEAKKQIEELNNDILYSAAEADNFRKESAKTIQSSKQFSVTEFAKDMLETADDLDKISSLCEDYKNVNGEISQSIQSILNGLELSCKVLSRVFERHGVQKFETKPGDKFNADFHNLLYTTPSTTEFPPEYIAKVVKKGYKIGDRVLRPAQVGVSEAREN